MSLNCQESYCKKITKSISHNDPGELQGHCVHYCKRVVGETSSCSQKNTLKMFLKHVYSTSSLQKEKQRKMFPTCEASWFFLSKLLSKCTLTVNIFRVENEHFSLGVLSTAAHFNSTKIVRKHGIKLLTFLELRTSTFHQECWALLPFFNSTKNSKKIRY